MVHRLDFNLGLHRLAAPDGGGSGDYSPLQLCGWRLKVNATVSILKPNQGNRDGEFWSKKVNYYNQ